MFNLSLLVAAMNSSLGRDGNVINPNMCLYVFSLCNMDKTFLGTEQLLVVEPCLEISIIITFPSYLGKFVTCHM